MLSESLRKWQDAEKRAQLAAHALQAALCKDAAPPDDMFIRLRQLRLEASMALDALMAEYGRESARLYASIAHSPAATPARRSRA